MTDFFVNYIPERGDLVYGLANPRNWYLDAYLKWWLENVYRDKLSGMIVGKTGTPEKRKETAISTLWDAQERSKINWYNDPISKVSFEDLDSVEFKSKLAGLGATDYLHGLEKTRSAVAKIGAASFRSLSKGDSRLKEADFEQISTRALGELRFFLAVGRACKYGIDYVLTRPTVRFGTSTGVFQGEPKLHYVLDTLEYSPVAPDGTFSTTWGRITSANTAEKEKFPLTAFEDKRKGTPITTSELRYLFRTWHTYKELLGRRLLFYEGQNVTDPLWDQKPAPWIPYAQARVAKLGDGEKKRYAKEISEFNDAVSSGNPKLALAKFFSMKTCDPIKEVV